MFGCVNPSPAHIKWHYCPSLTGTHFKQALHEHHFCVSFSKKSNQPLLLCTSVFAFASSPHGCMFWLKQIFFAVQYKLVRYADIRASKGSGAISINDCRAGCAKHGLVLMRLDSVNNMKHVFKLPDFKTTQFVFTDGIENVTNGVSAMFSSPGGEPINFVTFVSPFDRTGVASDSFCLAISGNVFSSRGCTLGVNDLCACKAKGEWINCISVELPWYEKKQFAFTSTNTSAVLVLV